MKTNLIKAIRQKTKSNKGESLAETMMSALIAAMAMTMLAGALIAAANVNKTSEDINPFADYGNAGTPQKVTKIQNTKAVIKCGDDSTGEISIDIYGNDTGDDGEKDNSGKVYYYEASK